MQTSLGNQNFTWAENMDLTRAQYNDAADSWDGTLQRLGFCKAYREVLKVGLEPFGYAPVRKLLEIGVGTGELSLALTDIFKDTNASPLDVCGIDLSSEMLLQAERKLSGPKVRFQGLQTPAESLPISSGSFDLVSAAHVIEHSKSPLKLMSEMERVLRPGGLMIIMMTRCNPVTRSIQKKWHVQCARSQKLEAVLRDFGMENIQNIPYPDSFVCNLLSFCFIAQKRKE